MGRGASRTGSIPIKRIPIQTNALAIQRRLSTCSFRKIFAAAMFATNVSADDAGPTKLRFAQFSGVSKLKNERAIFRIAHQNIPDVRTLSAAETIPWRLRTSL